MSSATITKTSVRSDFAYARHLMRLAETALAANDLDELNIIAHDLAAATSSLLDYCDERGCQI